MKQNVILMHGSFGNPYKGFFPWLYKKLSKWGYNCLAPHCPSGKGQNYETWSNILNEYYKNDYIDENTTIITHSLGSIFIVKFLHEHDIKIKKLITVAGFNNIEFENSYLYDTFYINEKNIDVAKNAVSLYSTNDPYIPVDSAKEFAKLINSTPIEIKNAGHFTASDGYEEFKEILDYIKD